MPEDIFEFRSPDEFSFHSQGLVKLTPHYPVPPASKVENRASLSRFDASANARRSLCRSVHVLVLRAVGRYPIEIIPQEPLAQLSQRQRTRFMLRCAGLPAYFTIVW
jgi:hypothetical protein